MGRCKSQITALARAPLSVRNGIGIRRADNNASMASPGPRKQVTLRPAAMVHQCPCGGGGFDTFGNQLEIESVGEADDRADNCQIVDVVTQVADEPGVDLQRVDGQGPEMRENGVAGAEASMEACTRGL
jgi:hypothetical protein